MKVGDTVKCINSTGLRDKLTLNSHYKVLGFDNLWDIIRIIDDRGWDDWWDKGLFELVTKETPKTMNVGDTVKCINSNGYSNRISVNKHYQIVECDNSRYPIRIIDNEGIKSWWSKERFELVNEEQQPFNTGDVVRCVKPTLDKSFLSEGTQYTILGYSKNTDTVKVKDDRDIESWWATYRFKHVTNIQQDQKPMDNTIKNKAHALYITMQDAYVKHSDLKVGDRVKVTSKATSQQQGWYCLWHSGLDEYVGKIGYVTEISFAGIRVSLTKNGTNAFFFPYFVVDKAGVELPDPIKLPSGEYDVKFDSNGDIKVGCQSIDYDTLKTIYKTASKVRAENA